MNLLLHERRRRQSRLQGRTAAGRTRQSCDRDSPARRVFVRDSQKSLALPAEDAGPTRGDALPETRLK